MSIANIIFYSSGKGGRYTPPQTGFRPQINIGGIHTSCVVNSLNGEQFFDFDKEYNVFLELMFPDQYELPCKGGDKISLYEGSKLIGEGEIVAES